MRPLAWYQLREEIEDFCARIFVQQLNGVPQIAGGHVMSIVKPGRQYEDFFHSRTLTVFYACYDNVTVMLTFIHIFIHKLFTAIFCSFFVRFLIRRLFNQ